MGILEQCDQCLHYIIAAGTQRYSVQQGGWITVVIQSLSVFPSLSD